MRKRFAAIPVILSAALLMSGCASGPPRQLVTIQLEQPLGFIQDGHWATEYVDIRAFQAYLTAEAPRTGGALWHRVVFSGGSERYIPWEEVSSVVPHKDGTKAILVEKNGKESYPNYYWLRWCPSGVVPDASESTKNLCGYVETVIGSKVDMRAYSKLQEDKTGPIAYVDSLVKQVRPLSASSAKAQKAKLVEAYEYNKQAERRSAQAADEARKAAEQRRRDTLKNAQKGLSANCTSAFGVARGEPAPMNMAVECGGLGSTSLAELREFGWNTRLIGRIPFEAFGGGAADRFEFEVTKVR